MQLPHAAPQPRLLLQQQDAPASSSTLAAGAAGANNCVLQSVPTHSKKHQLIHLLPPFLTGAGVQLPHATLQPCILWRCQDTPTSPSAFAAGAVGTCRAPHRGAKGRCHCSVCDLDAAVPGRVGETNFLGCLSCLLAENLERCQKAAALSEQ